MAAPTGKVSTSETDNDFPEDQIWREVEGPLAVEQVDR